MPERLAVCAVVCDSLHAAGQAGINSALAAARVDQKVDRCSSHAQCGEM